jgi:hypothetical protein
MKNLFTAFLLLTLFSVVNNVFGQDNYFITLSTVKCRAMAMGGATTSLSDDLSSLDINPAALSLYSTPKQHRITVFLNPIFPIAAAIRNKEITQGTHTWATDAAIGTGFLVKGIAFSAKALDVALLFGEELPEFGDRNHKTQVFQLDNYINNLTNTLVARVRLADQVSIGVSTILMRANLDDNIDWGVGLSYGILLRPDSGIDVGLVYHDLPNNMSDSRVAIDRIVDETLNLGISYELFNSTLLSADIRSISEESGVLTREVHAGIEQKVLNHFAIRGGYYRAKSERTDVYSCGVGILDINQFVDTGNRFNHSDYALEYSMVYKHNELEKSFWHFVSLLLRI